MTNAKKESGGAGSKGTGGPRRTLRDVAQLAGVDPSIVSRVLGGEEGRVSAPTRERILNAAKTLNYSPHQLARGLRTGRTSMIAMLVPHLSDPAYFNMMAGAKEAAVEAGYVVLFADTNDEDGLEVSEIERLEGRVDGIVSATARRDAPSLARLSDSRRPVVLLNRHGDSDLPAVIGRDEVGAAIAIDHLVKLGHRRIAHVSGPLALDPSMRRRRGYVEAMAAAGLETSADWQVEAALDEAAAEECVKKLLGLPQGRRPTAMFCSTFPSALGALGALRAAGVGVPEEISVVGLDDHPLADHLWAPLSTIRMPHVTMGRMAVDLLMRIVRNETAPHRTIVEQPPELVIRSSTGPVAKRRRRST